MKVFLKSRSENYIVHPVFALKKSSLNYRAVDISFRRAATKILKSWQNSPLSLSWVHSEREQALERYF
jgi:hypothetical protein